SPPQGGRGTRRACERGAGRRDIQRRRCAVGRTAAAHLGRTCALQRTPDSPWRRAGVGARSRAGLRCSLATQVPPQDPRAGSPRRASCAGARRPYRRAGARPQNPRPAVESANGQRPAASLRGRAVNRLAFGNTSLLFLISALLCLAVADIAVTSLNPWGEI